MLQKLGPFRIRQCTSNVHRDSLLCEWISLSSFPIPPPLTGKMVTPSNLKQQPVRGPTAADKNRQTNTALLSNAHTDTHKREKGTKTEATNTYVELHVLWSIPCSLSCQSQKRQLSTVEIDVKWSDNYLSNLCAAHFTRPISSLNTPPSSFNWAFSDCCSHHRAMHKR